MIITVTMNPAIDKTIEIPTLINGSLNRIEKVEYDIGGKGINVSRVIKQLGGNSICTGFIADHDGNNIISSLQEKDIQCDFIRVPGITRTNTKIIESDGTLTELNEPGFYVNEKQYTELKEKLIHYANKDTIFVLSGSLPAGISKNVYRDLIVLLKEKGANVLLDADKEAFYKAIESGPDIIKPNIVEFSDYFQQNIFDLDDVIIKSEIIKRKGIKNIIISMGDKGAIFLFEKYKAFCPALAVKSHSSVGAGDAMVAALAYSWDHHLNTEDTIKLCMASSAGAVTTIGTKPPSMETVNQLKNKVIIHKI